ncbi:MAG: DUF1186 domain-containing protein [Ferruginibacter sp.]
MAAKEHFNFTITEVPQLTNTDYTIDARASMLLDKTYFEVTKKKGKEKELLQYIEEYPYLPEFKNRLATFYSVKGMWEKAMAINQQTIRQHPNYLFAKITLAIDYYYQKEYSKIPELLGENLQLDSLYPHKKSFHVSEVMNYYKVVALYLNAVDKIKQAWEIIAKMENACPGHPEINETTKEIIRYNLSNMPERWKKDIESEIKIDGKFIQSVPQTNTAPVFENKLVEALGQFDFRLPETILQQLLLLPDESLKRDMQKALKDGIARYHYFMEHQELAREKSFFLIHAVFIIAEKKWTDLLPDIFQVLKNGKSFNEFYFGNSLTSLLWIAWYKLGDANPQPLFDFLKERNTDTFGKTGINQALVQLYWQQKKLRQQIINGYKVLAAYFIDNKNDNTLIDTIVIGSTACAMRDTSLTDLENEIKQLYENKLISLGYAGDFESLIEYEKTESKIIEKVPGMYEMYQDVLATWADYQEEDDDDDLYEDWDVPVQTIVRTADKIGRNDTCLCGSGKKYKKCCLKDA